MGPELSWLERTPDKREVDGSSPFRPTILIGPLVKWFNTHAFHACIHGFESRTGHHKKCLTVRVGHDKLIKSPKQGDEKFFEN